MKELEKTKIQIKDLPYVDLDVYYLNGNINDVAKYILGIKKLLKDAYTIRENESSSYKIRPVFTPFKDYKYIEMNVTYDNYEGQDLKVRVFRDETDEELEKRKLAIEQKILAGKKEAESKKLIQEKREKALLEKLKKKYDTNK